MDCLEGIKLIPDESVDLIVTDPPYRLTSGGSKNSNLGGIFSHVDEGGYGNDGEIVPCDISWKEIMETCHKPLKEGCHAYIMVNNRNMEEALYEARKVGFKFHNILVWDKGTVTPNRYYMNQLEFCLFLYKERSKCIKDCSLSNLFRVKNNDKNGHPTGKPNKLMECWVEQSSNENDLILDPFIGSGTTAVACVNTKRRFIGFELDKGYYDIACKRIEDAKNQPKLFY